MVTKVAETIKARERTHGNFALTANIARQLKGVVDVYGDGLSDMQREALDMIMTKVSRILSGNPDHADSWHDIAGYAKLVEGTPHE